ncbi:MAG: pyridoxal phosphate-dependent aminotransferase [Verrucomicrobiota bacterium]
MKIVDRMKRVQPSVTMALTAQAKALAAAGKEVYIFGSGEPDFATPAHIQEAGIAGMKAGHTKYTPSSGIKPLRDAVAASVKRAIGWDVSFDQVVVATGAKPAIFNALFVTCEAGDEVIYTAPYWVSYPDMINLLGATPVEIDTAPTGFKLTPEQLERAITPRTRVVMLCYPSNPTGQILTRAEARALADVLLKHPEIVVLSDEIYDQLVYDGAKCWSVLEVEPRLRERAVLVNGVSKAYAMTGWRIGWSVSTKPIAAAIDTLQSHQTSNPTAFCQDAALAAVVGDQTCVAEMRTAFDRRRGVMVAALQAMPGVTCPPPPGAFYVFPEVTGLLTKKFRGATIGTVDQLAMLLLKEAGVAVIPGTAFGSTRHIRLSYACSDDTIKKGMAKFSAFVGSLE